MLGHSQLWDNTIPVSLEGLDLTTKESLFKRVVCEKHLKNAFANLIHTLI